MKPAGGYGVPGAPPQHQQGPRPTFNPRHLPPNPQLVAQPPHPAMMSQPPPHRHPTPPGAGPHHRPSQYPPGAGGQPGGPAGMGPRGGHQHQTGNR